MASGLENIETIESPFRRFVTTIGVFPTAFTDAMTYYECLAYLVKYLEETVIPAVNENAEALEELQQLYVQLKSYVENYFDNLDVQEEINNKLDDMVEAGTLQEIIGEYLNATAVWGFDTVADMKVSTNLINGSFARTLGYHTKGDGGSGLYKIRNITNDDVVDEGKIIEIGDAGNNLIAELIIGDSVTPEQFGAYGDGTHDDQPAMALALSHCKTLDLIERKTYLLGSSLTLTYKMIINGNNSLLKGDGVSDYPIIFVNGRTSPAYCTKNIIKDFKIDGQSTNIGIRFEYAADFTVDNVYVQSCKYGFQFRNSLIFQFLNCHAQTCDIALYNDDTTYSVCNNIKFDKCRFIANRCVMDSVGFAYKNALFVNCEIEANNNTTGDAVIILPAKQAGTGGSSLIFEGCWFEANVPRDILSATDDYTPISVTNCYITHPANTAYAFAKGTDANFTIILDRCQDLSQYINSGKTIDSTSNYVSEMNCKSRISQYALAGVVGLCDNFGTVNKTSIWELNLLQNGSTKTGQIKAASDFVNISANDTNGVRLNDCNYLHPFILGNIYLWPYSNKLYYKIGSMPASYNDGTVLAE